MKKILFLFALAFAYNTAHAQFSYIASDSTIIIKSGDIATYDSVNIVLVAMRYFAFDGQWVATVGIAGAGATTDFATTLDIPFAQADVDALTGSGGTETRVMANTILQIIVDYLEVLNPGVGFTIH